MAIHGAGATDSWVLEAPNKLCKSQKKRATYRPYKMRLRQCEQDVAATIEVEDVVGDARLEAVVILDDGPSKGLDLATVTGDDLSNLQVIEDMR